MLVLDVDVGRASNLIYWQNISQHLISWSSTSSQILQPSPRPTQTQTQMARQANRWVIIPISVYKVKVSHMVTSACQNVDNIHRHRCRPGVNNLYRSIWQFYTIPSRWFFLLLKYVVINSSHPSAASVTWDIIGSGNGLVPDRQQAITRTNVN